MEKQIAAMHAIPPEVRLAQLEAEKKALEQHIPAGRNNGEVSKGAVLRPQDK